jgi:nicotinamidase-related amidase
MGDEIVYGPLGPRCVHLCVDMQRLFAERTEWHTPWMDRVRPIVYQIASRHPMETIFTRFIPADRPGDGRGTWRRYYQRWASMALEALGDGMTSLVPELAELVPPARVIDKRVYSPWMDGTLNALLLERRIDSLVVTGGETDVCVFATVLGAIDRGYRIVIATDAVCSSSDASHDASMDVYRSRYGQQVEIATAAQVLDAWQ